MKYKKCKQMLLDAGYYEVNWADIYVCRFRKDRYKVIVSYNESGNVTRIICFDEKKINLVKKEDLLTQKPKKNIKMVFYF